MHGNPRRQSRYEETDCLSLLAIPKELRSPFISVALSVLKILEGYEGFNNDKPNLTVYPMDEAMRLSY